MFVLAWIVLLVGMYAFLLSLSNILWMHHLNILTKKTLSGRPTVSVCIPARNEEAVIEKSVRSFLAQSYAPLEILVLDDNSTDRTSQIVDRLAQEDGRIRRMAGRPLPEGWKGKINAEAQLASQAKGDFLLFTDADTDHGPFSIENGLKKLLATKSDLVSGYPQQKAKLKIDLVVVVMDFVTMLWIPLYLQQKLKAPFFANAIGQYLLIRRSALEDCGGFKEIRNSICDDMDLAKLMARCGCKQTFCDVKHDVSCTMYDSFHDALAGIERSIIGVLKGGWLMALALLPLIALLLVVVVSPVLAPWFMVASGFSLAGILLTAGTYLFWTAFCMITLWHGYKMPLPLLGPLVFFVLIIMAIHSFIRKQRGIGYEWKGRKIT